jgi:hypothetical protein
MGDAVIQFGQLETFLAEPAAAGQVVRVVVLELSRSLTTQTPELRQVQVGVHVRTINEAGHILACYLPVATVALYNGRRTGDPTWERYDAVWAEAEALQARVVACLQAVAGEQGWEIRPAGVIDLGEVRPLAGSWRGDPDRRGAEDGDG